MNFSKINILKPGRVVAVNIHFSSREKYICRYCEVYLKEKSVEFIENALLFSSINDLVDKIPAGMPIILNLTGKTVLTKIVSNEELESTLGQYQDSKGESDFYITQTCYNNLTGIGLCRKDVTDDILNKFLELAFDIIEINFGPFSCLKLWEYEISSQYKLPFGEQQLVKTEDENITVLPFKNDSDSDSIEVSGDFIISYLLPGYTAAMCWLLRIPCSSYFADKPQILGNDFYFRFYLKQLKYPALILVFLLVLFNFFVFNNLRSKENVLRGQLEINSGITTRLDSLEKELKAKEQIINYIGRNRTQYSSLLDKIAQTVPSRILLTKININPLDTKIKIGKELYFRKEILIEGIAKSSLSLNDWSKKLSQFDWIDDVVVVDYHRDDSENVGEFVIKVCIRK